MGGQTSPSGGASTPITDAPNKDWMTIDQWKESGGADKALDEFGNKLSNPLGIPDITSAVIFIGVILVGITLIATGGIISLKGKA
jgi:hypothetical protein